MSKETTIKHYRRAKEIFREIDERFHGFQSGTIEDTDFNLNEVINKLGELKRSLRYIVVSDLEGHYKHETIESVRHNTGIFKDALHFWGKFFLASKYAKNLKDPVTLKYVPDMRLEPRDIKRWGGSEKEVAKNVISTLVHPDNIERYERPIKRIALGTMSQNEFEKIFDVLRHKLTTHKAFESLDEYTKNFW